MTENKVVLLVLNTGEHILGLIERVLDDSFVVSKPVNMVPAPGGNPGKIMFIPYLQFVTGETCEFLITSLRHPPFFDVREDLANTYKQQFVTGIQVPQQNLILS